MRPMVLGPEPPGPLQLIRGGRKRACDTHVAAVLSMDLDLHEVEWEV
jgi:hypothetical protein